MDRFALVDENGLVYTENSIVLGSDIDTFFTEDLKEPVIRTQDLDGTRKQVILAAPVEGIVFQGIRIKVCFIQLNVDEMLDSLTLQTNENETFCNLYYYDGESLTNDDFGYLSAGMNLFAAVKDAQMKEGSSKEQLERDFAAGRRGQISFDYQGVPEELCYIPVEGTNWMLTILIRDSVISSQISSISSEMMRHSIIQIIITVISMLAVFLVLIHQSRKVREFFCSRKKKMETGFGLPMPRSRGSRRPWRIFMGLWVPAAGAWNLMNMGRWSPAYGQRRFAGCWDTLG